MSPTHDASTLEPPSEVKEPVWNWDDFKVGFWHPFGAHGHKSDGTVETAEEILTRKEGEVARNQWTLWSFAGNTCLPNLLYEIDCVNPPDVYALCSSSKNTKPPKGKPRWCRQYRLMGERTTWTDIPNCIEVPHPGNSVHVAAFWVTKVRPLLESERCPPDDARIEWFSTARNLWTRQFVPGRIGYPPRPETLIRRSKASARLRKVRAILTLGKPYLVLLR